LEIPIRLRAATIYKNNWTSGEMLKNLYPVSWWRLENKAGREKGGLKSSKIFKKLCSSMAIFLPRVSIAIEK
jgi:hypothetical protein